MNPIVQEEIALESGKSLQQRRGVWVLLPDGLSVEVAIHERTVTITDPNTRHGFEEKIAERPTKRPKTKGPERRPPSGDSGRWATHNAFVDTIAPHLSLAERAIWHVMFRHTRDGVCETTARQLAGSARVSTSTARQALARLQKVGLVWSIWKSGNRSKASKYGLHPRPSDCLARVRERPNRSDHRYGCQAKP